MRPINYSKQERKDVIYWMGSSLVIYSPLYKCNAQAEKFTDVY